MMLPSNAGTNQVPYNPAHRLYVWVKNGETVFWGFRAPNSGDVTFNWYYDNNSQTGTGLGYFPTATQNGNGRVSRQSESFNPGASGGGQGRPANATTAAAGPSQVNGVSGGYNARSFTNNTGQDRAFWLEVNTYNQEFNYWDITVASGSSGNYTRQNGRVYCKYWSLVNELPNRLGLPRTDAQNFADNFGFFIPIDNEKTALNDFFVKRARFGESSAGFVVFFANSDGPGTTGSADVRRRSITGTSNNAKYPLFLNDPDVSVWPSTVIPNWSVSAVFSKRPESETGGQGAFTVSSNTAGVVDVFVDLNANGVYNEGVDVLFSHEFTAAGDHVFNWNGKYGNGTDVPVNTPIKIITSIAFFPVHFPIYDMEQSLGITITHMRPGTPYNDVLYWDDSNITGYSPSNSPKSVIVNTTGLPGTQHIWHANGDNGFSQNNTINTWTGAFNKRSEFDFVFKYDVEVDLTVVKKISKEGGSLEDIETAGVGELVTFTITARNLSVESQQPVTATGVNVRDILPSGYEFVSRNLPPGTSWDDTNHDWVIGNLAVGEDKELTIVVRVLGTGEYRNEAVIRGNESEKNSNNNKDDATLQTFNVSGNVFHDPNGGVVGISTSGLVNSIPNAVVASLLNGNGEVMANEGVSVNDADKGAFKFEKVLAGSYTVVIGNISLVEGSTPTIPLPLPAGWLNTGDFNGAPNSGTNTTSIDGESESFEVEDRDVSNINFGIQQGPVSDDKIYNIEEPDADEVLTLNGTGDVPGPLSGSDPEDYPGGGSLVGKTVHITSLPVNGLLSYEPIAAARVAAINDVPFVIHNYDPSALKVTFTGGNYVQVLFNYSYEDNAGALSVPSVYSINWTPLPVKWISVDVAEEQGNAVVTWSTTEEMNVASFNVQHSIDGKSWIVVGTRAPMNSLAAQYRFVHQPGKAEIHYYRIQNVDLDGSTSLSPIVSLKATTFPAVSLYPNPVTDGLLRLSVDPTSIRQVSVYNLAGTEQIRAALKGSEINVGKLTPGVYVLRLVFENGTSTSQTFIVR